VNQQVQNFERGGQAFAFFRAVRMQNDLRLRVGDP
jgi:hypothetical protein